MENKRNSKNSKQALSWDEFKKRYFGEVEQLADLFGVDGSIKKDIEICSGNEIYQR